VDGTAEFSAAGRDWVTASVEAFWQPVKAAQRESDAVNRR
jgi:hypothetical protein